MSLLGRIFIVIVTVLSLIYLGAQATLSYHENNWRQAYERARSHHQQVVQAKEAQIAALRGSNSDLDRKIGELDALVTNLKDQLKALELSAQQRITEFNRLRSDFEQLQATHKEVSTNLQAKDDQIRDYLQRVTQLDGELKIAKDNLDRAQAQVARLLQQKTALEKDLGQARKDYADAKQKALDLQLMIDTAKSEHGVDLYQIVLGTPPVPAINGVVAGVDTSTEPASVLLSVGKDQGVERGYQFTIYRRDTFIGKVVVTKPMRDSSGARVLFTAPGQQIRAGDTAATRLD